MMKSHIRLCKHCGEGIVVAPERTIVQCHYCNTMHTVDWKPILHVSDRGWK